jgi:hypothetical protein
MKSLAELLEAFRIAAAAGERDLVRRFRPLFWAHSMADLRRLLAELGDDEVDGMLKGIVVGEQYQGSIDDE